MISRKAGNIT